MKFLSPNGSPIIGTLEAIRGIAQAGDYTETGSPEYEGGTLVDWDSQVSLKAKNADGSESLIYRDENGDQWTFDHLTFAVDEDDDA